MSPAATNATAPCEVSVVLPVPPEEAFRLLEDPASIRRIIAGARKIRRFDARWPEVGTRLEHTVGIPPLLARGQTEVVDQQRPERLRLDAMVRPIGHFRVEFRLAPHSDGTQLTVREEPEEGFVSWPVVRRASTLALQLRNRETCRRFRRLAERRRHGREGGRRA